MCQLLYISWVPLTWWAHTDKSWYETANYSWECEPKKNAGISWLPAEDENHMPKLRAKYTTKKENARHTGLQAPATGWPGQYGPVLGYPVWEKPADVPHPSLVCWAPAIQCTQTSYYFKGRADDNKVIAENKIKRIWGKCQRLKELCLRDKWDTDAGVGLDKLQQHLCPNFPKQVLNIIPNKHVIHDCSSIALQKWPGYKFNK